MYGDCSSEVITLQCCSYDAVRGVRGCQGVSTHINNAPGENAAETKQHPDSQVSSRDDTFPGQ